MLPILQRALRTAVDNLQITGKAAMVANYFEAGRAFMTEIYGPIYFGTDYVDLVKNGYKRNPDLYATINLIARAASSVDWYLVEDRNGEEVPYADEQLAKTIKNPNPSMTFTAWSRIAITDYLLAGNSFNYKIDVADRTREWTRLRPDYMAVNTSTNLIQPIKSYRYTFGANTELPVDSVIHWKTFDPVNEWYGMSPIEAALRSVAMGNAAIDWNTATLQNMGRFSGIMKFADTLSAEQKDGIRQAYDERYAGAQKAGQPIITDRDFEWVETSMTMKDADWFNGLNLTKQQIASVYGIDSGLIGDKTASTYNNQEQAVLRMYYDVVMPILSELEDIINSRIVSTWNPNVRLRFDFESIDAIKRDQAAAYTRLQNAWWLSPNERRAEIGYEALPDPAMDTVYIPAGNIPISEANIDVNVLPSPDA
jgi:HK97 family phage portal protein